MDETHKGFVFVKVSEENIIKSVKHLLKESDDKQIHGSRSYNILHLEGVEDSALFVVIVCLNQDKVLLPGTVDFFRKAGDDKVHGFVKLVWSLVTNILEFLLSPTRLYRSLDSMMYQTNSMG